MSLRTESLRCVGFVIAFAASLSVGATALAQPQGQNVSQEGTSRAGSRNAEATAPTNDIDAQTGKIINEAIELMDTDYAAAEQRIGTLRLDRLSPYERGRVEQIGNPFEIYNRPATAFVASFVGTLSMLKGRVIDPSAGLFEIDGQRISAGRSFVTSNHWSSRRRTVAWSLGSRHGAPSRDPGKPRLRRFASLSLAKKLVPDSPSR